MAEGSGHSSDEEEDWVPSPKRPGAADTSVIYPELLPVRTTPLFPCPSHITRTQPLEHSITLATVTGSEMGMTPKPTSNTLPRMSDGASGEVTGSLLGLMSRLGALGNRLGIQPGGGKWMREERQSPFQTLKTWMQPCLQPIHLNSPVPVGWWTWEFGMSNRAHDCLGWGATVMETWIHPCLVPSTSPPPARSTHPILSH